MGSKRRMLKPSAAVSWAVLIAFTTPMLAPLNASSAFEPAAQSSASAVQNTQVVVNGGVVNIGYDLDGPATQTFDVSLEVSEDGGRTYTLKPQSISGDLGAGIAGGSGKRIVWEASKDTDSLQMDRFRFRVSAQRTDASVTLPVMIQPKAEQQPVAKIPKGSASGRSFKWPAISMLGAGLILGGTGFGPLKKTETVAHTLDWSHFNTTDHTCIDDSSAIILNFSGSLETCTVSRKVNNIPVIGGGLAIAGVGAALLFIGGKNRTSPEIDIIPGGFAIHRQFSW